MRLRPARLTPAVISASLALIACSSDNSTVGPGPGPGHNLPPVWSEITNFPASVTIYGMWAPSADNIIAVGAGGRIWQWSGVQWTELSHLDPNDLYAIDGSTTGDVIAVGEHGTVLQQQGGQFYPRDAGVTSGLHGVWRAPNTDEFVIVGDGGTILRGNNNTWAPEPSGTNSVLLSVWGTDDVNIFAVGVDGIILHYDGGAWTRMNSGTTEILASVNGTLANDVYAAGGAGTLLHYDGDTWRAVESNTTDFLQSVCAPCGAAVGANGTVIQLTNGAFKREGVPGAPWLYAIARAGADEWAMGTNAMLRHDDTGWSPQTRGNVPLLRAMTSNAALGLVAVGDRGIAMTKGPSSWNFEDAGPVMRLNTVYTDTDGEVYAAGLNRIFHRTSQGWEIQNSSTVEYFALGGNAGHLFVVGSNATLLEHAGSVWSPVSVSGTAADYHGICMTDTSGYIVGTGGTVLVYDRNQWTAKNVGTSLTLWDVMPLSDASYRAVAVGANGASFGVPRDDAATWLRMDTPVSATLYSLAFGPGGNLYAAGANGTLLRLDDITWTLVPTPTTRTFLNAWDRDGALFLCGGSDTSGGMLFRYGPPSP